MLTNVVLMPAPAAPLMVANTKASSSTIVGSHAAIRGDARNVRNPIRNPTAPKIASTDTLDAIFYHYCWLLSESEILIPELGIEGNLSVTFCSATAEASIII